jgi:hypothetical protein
MTHAHATAPAPEEVQRMAAVLNELVDDPDLYWPTLVDLLCQDMAVLEVVHLRHCQEPGCATCSEIGRTWVMLAAHDAVQPSGCGCSDHRTYPRRRPQRSASEVTR